MATSTSVVPRSCCASIFRRLFRGLESLVRAPTFSSMFESIPMNILWPQAIVMEILDIATLVPLERTPLGPNDPRCPLSAAEEIVQSFDSRHHLSVISSDGSSHKDKINCFQS